MKAILPSISPKRGFAGSSFGHLINLASEGRTMYGDVKLCGHSNISKCMICTCWHGNTVDKDRFLEHQIDMDLNGESLIILKKII